MFSIMLLLWSAPQVRCAIILNRFIAWRCLVFKYLIWGTKYNLLSKYKPKNLTSLTTGSGWLFRNSEGSGCNCLWLQKCTVWVKKTMQLTVYHNLSKCRRIYKILSLSDSWGNFVHKHHKDSPSNLKCVSTLPCES